MTRRADSIWGPPHAPDAPFEPLCVAAFVTGLIGFPGAWILAILGVSRATLRVQKGRVLGMFGAALGALWSVFWLLVLVIRLTSAP